MYATSFSVAIVCVSVSGGTHLLGMVEANRGEILSLVEQKQCMDHIQLASLDCGADSAI